jgi:hypothetical protein
VQVDPIKPTLKAPGIKLFRLKYDKLLSNFAFKFNWRRYNKARLRAWRRAQQQQEKQAQQDKRQEQQELEQFLEHGHGAPVKLHQLQHQRQYHPAAAAAMEAAGMKVVTPEPWDYTAPGSMARARARAAAGGFCSAGVGEDDDDEEEEDEVECNIHDLRLRGTNVNDTGVLLLLALTKISLLDCSACPGVRCAALGPVAQKYRLSSMHPQDKQGGC